jgi:hypothetical protein
MASVAPAAQSATLAQSGESEGFFSSLARKVGLGGSAAADATGTATTTPPTTAKPKVADAKPKPAKTDTKQASAKPAPNKPAVTTGTAADTAAPAAAPAASNSLVAGAQPVVSANSFESRFSAGK